MRFPGWLVVQKGFTQQAMNDAVRSNIIENLIRKPGVNRFAAT
jgi:hypothetical protein